MRNPRPFLILLAFLILTLALAFAAGPDRAPALAEKGAAATGANSPENPAGMDHPLPTAVPASSEQSLVSRAVDSVAEGQQTEKLNGARRGASDEGLESETNTQAGESAPAEGEAGQQMENAAISTADVTASPTRFPSPSPTTPPSPTPSPTPIPSPTPTPQPTWTPWPTNTPTPVPTPQFVNGMSSEAFIIMDEDTRQHIRDIYYQGQEKGRNPQGLSRIGASIIETDQFLLRFGIGNYDLGPYQHLQPVVDYFASSFARYGVGIRRGLTAWMVLDPSRVDESVCLPGETMLVCEIRLNNPSILILVLGTNDIGAVERFEESMRAIIEYTVGQGVIPILTTKADRYEGGENRNNLVLHRLANEYDIPLWDFDIVAETLPGKGLARDNVHLTFLIDFDYNDPLALERGYGVYNLTALIMLDEVLREMKATVLDSGHIPE